MSTEKVRDRVVLQRKELKLDGHFPDEREGKDNTMEGAQSAAPVSSPAPEANDIQAVQRKANTTLPQSEGGKEDPSKLPDQLRGQMEGAMGTSFGGVKVVQNSSAAVQMKALAYAQGNEVHFAPGQYNPQSPQGKALIGHELAHVKQQQQGKVKANTQVGGAPVNNDPGLESEADQLGQMAANYQGSAANAGAGNVSASGPVQAKFEEPNRNPEKKKKPKDLEAKGDGMDPRTFSLTGTSTTGNMDSGDDSELDAETGNSDQAKDGVRSPVDPAEDESQNPAFSVTGADRQEGAEDEDEEGNERETASSETTEVSSTEGAEQQAEQTEAEALNERGNLDAEAENAENEGEETPDVEAEAANQEEAEGETEEGGEKKAQAEGEGEPNEEQKATNEKQVSGGDKLGTQLAAKLGARQNPAAQETPLPEKEKGLSLLEMVQANGADASAADGPQTQAPPVQRVEDPDQQPQTDISRFAAQIQQAGQAAIQGVTAAAAGLRAQAQGRAQGLHAQVDAKFDAGVTQIRLAFQTQRSTLQSDIATLRSEVQSQYTQGATELTNKGTASKARIDELFNTFKQGIDTKITTYAQRAQTLSTTSQSSFRTELQAQAQRARSMGTSRSGSFGGDEKGQKQRAAVLEVANKAAEEMEGKIGDNVQAIADICDPMPDKFREEGEKLKTSVDDGKQPLLDQVDQQVLQAQQALERERIQADTKVTELETSITTQLGQAEEAAIQTLESRKASAHQRVDTMIQQFNEQLDHGLNNATERLQSAQQDAQQVLQSNSSASEKDLERFTSTTVSSFGAMQTEIVGSLTQGLGAFEPQFAAVLSAADQDVTSQTDAASTALSNVASQVATRITTFTTQVSDNIRQALEGFDTSTTQFHQGIEQEFNSQLTGLETKFGEMMTEAEGKVNEAKQEGLAKNQEAINELGAKMDSAARDAAWRHDHPVLAAIGSALSFIGGLLVGILAVLVLVVVVIVAFKVILALLVAAGISLIVAKIILVVAGLALLGYMAYQAYQARRTAGQGGWQAALGALGDVTGISDIVRGFSEPGLSAFDRGFFIGKGAATLATFFFGRRINATIDRGIGRIASSARFPRIANFARNVQNPQISSFGEGMRARFPRVFNGMDRAAQGLQNLGNRISGGMNRLLGRNRPPQQQVPPQDRGLSDRGYRPQPGERNMTREQWRAQNRQQRMETNAPARVQRAQNMATELETMLTNARANGTRSPQMAERYQQLYQELQNLRNLADTDPIAAMRGLNGLRGRVQVAARIQAIRDGFTNAGVTLDNVGGRNIAEMTYNVRVGNGQPISGREISISGKEGVQNAIPRVRAAQGDNPLAGAEMTPNAPTPPRFQNTRTNPIEGQGGHQDSEAKFFESLLARMQRQSGVRYTPGQVYRDVHGQINLISEMTPCSRCGGIIQQVRAMFPNLTVNVQRGVNYP